MQACNSAFNRRANAMASSITNKCDAAGFTAANKERNIDTSVVFSLTPRFGGRNAPLRPSTPMPG
jgi:hypothetical protein